ncbi:MAG: hypothetical protein ACUVRU_10870 [Anaerolineae bacterium]
MNSELLIFIVATLGAAFVAAMSLLFAQREAMPQKIALQRARAGVRLRRNLNARH